MTIDTRLQTLPFSIENAFTDQLGGGNPAAIVHLPSLTSLPDTTLQTMAANFNQPMTVFIAPLAPGEHNVDPSSWATTTTFGIRWFTPKIEVPLCGHATLAAAAAIFRDVGRGAEDPTAIRFQATSGKFLIARKVEEDRIEIDLDSEKSVALSMEEDIKVRGVLTKALGKDVPVRYTGRGAGHLNYYALVEVDTLDLKNLRVNTDAFLESPFIGHVVVAPSSVPGVTFESRMFAARAGIPEDPVCGTAHALATPYWMAAKNLSGVVFAKQVSFRGGDLRILFDAGERRIKLAGQVRGVSRGELYI
ncbi:Diaminopimelate epimerase-like protein [Russula compacta]|nr:Diaminopimelate epimerase-like protein [Russula compacta]